MIPSCSKYIWGEEYGKSGETPHIQGAFILNKKQRAEYIQKHFFEFPVHLMRLKDWKASLDYCQKECNKIVSNSLPYVCEIPNLFDWQQDVLDILKDKPNDRTIHWIYDYRGCKGKTTLCKYIFTHYKDVIVTGGRECDMFNGIVKYQELNNSLPKIVLIDIPRSKENFVSWSGIEKIKDMFFIRANMKEVWFVVNLRTSYVSVISMLLSTKYQMIDGTSVNFALNQNKSKIYSSFA